MGNALQSLLWYSALLPFKIDGWKNARCHTHLHIVVWCTRALRANFASEEWTHVHSPSLGHMQDNSLYPNKHDLRARRVDWLLNNILDDLTEYYVQKECANDFKGQNTAAETQIKQTIKASSSIDDDLVKSWPKDFEDQLLWKEQVWERLGLALQMQVYWVQFQAEMSASLQW